ncbi:MAG: sugar phosphate isomerase/epimerase [Chloroflexi bacterium]|nr:sugar phosphate isomerase/epimerase [Chloroflexota bacterium]
MADDLSRLCVHTITTRPWSVEEAVDQYAAAGIKGITVWRQWLEGRDANEVGERIRSAGLTMVSLCRGGFFPASDLTARRAAIDDNLRAIDEAAAIGAPLIVLVCGASPDVPLSEARKQIQAGIEAVLPYAAANGVKLAIEPLHPMYADSRSAINTLKQANDMCMAIGSSLIGVTVDVYHLWWDPDLAFEIARCGANGLLFSFHICDWLTPTADLLNGRGLMGEGCIPIPQIRGWVEDAGYSGFNEVEIFSDRHWARDQHEFIHDIINAYQEHS